MAEFNGRQRKLPSVCTAITLLSLPCLVLPRSQQLPGHIYTLIKNKPVAKMFPRILSGVNSISRVISTTAQRNIGLSAPAMQTAAPALDPIQQLFVSKIREYADKSKTAGGQMVDVTADVKASLNEELNKVNRAYNAEGQDMTKFPAFTWSDPTLEPVSVKIEASAAAEAAVAQEIEEDEAQLPYFEM
ncbi:ATP synthase-coupling factor 6, mitochondrial-like [Argonauta hians]